MLSAVTSLLIGRRSEQAGAPDASSSRTQPPRSRPYTRDDDDDNRSIASDVPPSDDEDQGRRRHSSYIPAHRQGGRSSRAMAPKTYATAPRRPGRRLSQDGASPKCIICNVKPSFVHPTTGKKYPTCGNTCADALSMLCEVCLARPRNGAYTTCGTTCGKALKAQKALCLQCKSRPKLVDANGKEFSHCGKTCRDAAQAGLPPLPSPTPTPRRVAPNRAPTMGRNVVANPPHTFETLKARARESAPCFLEIPKNHAQFHKVLDLFNTDWESEDRAPPAVIGIYSIIQTEALTARYDRYRAHLTGRGLSPTKGRRWVGAKCSCRARPQIKPPCSAYDCNMCDVLTRSVFGTSSYPGAAVLSGHSNRADALAFSDQSRRHKGIKAVILAKLVGSDDVVPRLTFQEAYTNRENGRGKDVIQLSSDQRGHKLPSDQLLVFNTDAIIPRYAILYG